LLHHGIRFLNGPGFQKMRADLRQEADEIYMVDCSPEGHQPAVSTRIFQGVQQPVCIVLALRRSPEKNEQPATVRFRSLSEGSREHNSSSWPPLRSTEGGSKRRASGGRRFSPPARPNGSAIPRSRICSTITVRA
jgi:hypothetical protein